MSSLKNYIAKLREKWRKEQLPQLRRVGYYRGICRFCYRMIGTYIYMDRNDNIIINCGHCGLGQWEAIKASSSSIDKIYKALVMWEMKIEDTYEELDTTIWTL